MNAKVLWSVVIVVLVLVAAVLLLNQGQRQQTTPEAAVTTPTQVPTKEASPTAAIKEEGKMTEENTVTATKDGFDPKSLTTKTGAEVTWVNQSGATISINSSPHPQHTDYPPLNLGLVKDGESTSLVFDKPGTYKYHDHLNPKNFGTIVVE